MFVCLSNAMFRPKTSVKKVWVYDTCKCALNQVRICKLYDGMLCNGQNGYVAIEANDYGVHIRCLSDLGVVFEAKNELGDLMRIGKDRWYYYDVNGYFYDIQHVYNSALCKSGYIINSVFITDEFIYQNGVSIRDLRDVASIATSAELLLTGDGLVLFLFPTKKVGTAYVPVYVDAEIGVPCTYSQFRKRVVYG